MSLIPSIGLVELIILAGIASLVMLIVAVITVAVVRRRKRDDARPWKWIAIFGLILVVLPLLVVVLGVLLVTPLRVERSYIATPQVVLVPVEPTTALTSTLTADVSPPNPMLVGDTAPSAWAIVPDSWLEALAIPPIIASPVLLVGAAIVAVVLRRWADSNAQSEDSNGNGGRWARLRYVFLALAFWIALSIFLILDFGLGLAVSIYPRFVAIYAAFWVLVGALLLHGKPIREKALILVLFLVVVFSVRFIDWNSRKPFLRDFYRIKEGMMESQVNQIMSGYMKGYYGGPPPSLREYEPEFDEQGKIVTGWVTYRHTDEGWGDSDWGTVTFEDGYVVQKRFSSAPTDTLHPAETPTERAAVAPTRTIGTPTTTPEFTDDEFSVYLVAQAITAHEMLQINLDELELEDSPIISLDDVVAYAPTTHEMQLTESAYERIGRLEVPVQGLPFVVCVGRERIYGGAFWASYSSLTYGGVVINTSPATVNDPDRILRIELGYPPSPELFVGKDLRSDPWIIEALEAANKLR